MALLKMKLSIKDFFKIGGFLFNLEEYIVEIKRQLNLNSSSIKELRADNSKLLQHIKLLQNENVELKAKLLQLDERVWNLNIVSNTDTLLIVKENALQQAITQNNGA